MLQEKTKVYIYTRVSTAMQIDGYSLDAQKARMKAYADFNDYQIVGEYEDAGKSGKSIEGRASFCRMMEDIKSGKDGVAYVLVFKLSRFGRNAADVLSTLQVMQDFGVNLICVEDGIDSSKDAGKLMISVLSAVAEIERENIRVQTMEGRIQKAREGRWNGGFAPYGYRLVDGVLQINEDEAPAIRTIFEQYVNTDTGANGLSKYLETHGFQKLARQNGTSPLFSATLIRAILKNPVYCGKIAFGRRKLEKIHGTRNEYHQVPQENYLLVDGLHEGIVSEELWNAAQVKLLAQSKRYEPVNRSKTEQAHLLSALVKCPICGAGMYSNKCTKYKKDGTAYKSFSYYSCKHRKMQRGQKCDFTKQIQEEVLDSAVVEVIIKLVSNPKFAAMMQEKINGKVDTTAIEQEIAAAEKQLRQYYSVKSKLMEEIDNLAPDDRHYIMRKSDLDERLYRMYDKIEEAENNLMDARAKKQAIEAAKITGDNIYKVLICFEKLYNVMNSLERKKLMEHLISEIQIYPERQPNGQWLKSIKFRLPIVESDIDLCLDNESHTECVIALSKGEIDSKKVRVEFSLEGLDTSGLQKGATYPEIKARVLEQTGMKVSSLYISQVKQKCGLEVRENHHKTKSENVKQPQCPPEKEVAIRDALKYFKMI
jgi:site-specific DNA recombinase